MKLCAGKERTVLLTGFHPTEHLNYISSFQKTTLKNRNLNQTSREWPMLNNT
jgi:hypothetical protein